jgi:hypothetical protein
MAKYRVRDEDNLSEAIVDEATSARRAAEHGAERLHDEGRFPDWIGGIKVFCVERIMPKPSQKSQLWKFQLMLSNPHALIQVVGEIN